MHKFTHEIHGRIFFNFRPTPITPYKPGQAKAPASKNTIETLLVNFLKIHHLK